MGYVGGKWEIACVNAMGVEEGANCAAESGDKDKDVTTGVVPKLPCS